MLANPVTRHGSGHQLRSDGVLCRRPGSGRLRRRWPASRLLVVSLPGGWSWSPRGGQSSRLFGLGAKAGEPASRTATRPGGADLDRRDHPVDHVRPGFPEPDHVGGLPHQEIFGVVALTEPGQRDVHCSRFSRRPAGAGTAALPTARPTTDPAPRIQGSQPPPPEPAGRSEIGLRRALGATKGHIRIQFLTEAMLLALLGGGAGVGLGVAATAVYAHSQHWATVIPPVAWARSTNTS